MSLKLWYIISVTATVLFLCAFSAWALVQWSRGAGIMFLVDSMASLVLCLLGITHGVLYWRRLREVSLL